MTTFSQVSSALRRNNRKNYGLLCGCCFFSVLLITTCLRESPPSGRTESTVGERIMET